MVRSHRPPSSRSRGSCTAGEGASLGDVFSFVSGLYFRGKLAYARRFARPPDPDDPVSAGGVLVITPNAGLRAADTPHHARGVSWRSPTASIDLANVAYRRPLERGARALRERSARVRSRVARQRRVRQVRRCPAADLRRQLVFPRHFVGRGDMSRGGLMLRCACWPASSSSTCRSPAPTRHGERAAEAGANPNHEVMANAKGAKTSDSCSS